MQALREIELPGIKKLRSGKVREVFDLGDTLLFVASDRLSALGNDQNFAFGGDFVQQSQAFRLEFTGTYGMVLHTSSLELTR